MKKLLLMLSLMFLAVCALAQIAAKDSTSSQCRITEHSIFKECDVTGPERSGSMSKEDLTVAEFDIGRATLDEVSSQFPGVQKFRLTKQEESPLGICVKNKEGAAVVFASGSSGGWDVLDAIYVARASSLEARGAKCVLAPSLPNDLATQSGMRLGATVKQVQRLFPKLVMHDSVFKITLSTSPDKAPWVSDKIKPTKGEGWVAMSGAVGGFRSGRLRWFILYGGVSD